MISKPAWIGGAALAVVLGVLITVAVVVDYTDGERPGVAFPLTGDIDSAHEAKVKLPLGTLTVKVGAASQDFDVDSDKSTRAADGAVFVPVSWDIAGAEVAVSNSVPVYQFQLTLVADGRRYDLQTAHEDEPERTPSVPIVASGSVATVVEGEGNNLSLEVEYDGLTQVLDVDSGKIDPGLAAPYYRKGGLPTLSTGEGCSAVSAADAKTVSVTLNKCRLGPATLQPYVGGLGWVESATEAWVSVPYSLQVGTIYRRDDFANYSTEVRRFDVTLDGAKPSADILRYRHQGTVLIGGYKIFRTATTPKSLGLTSELVGDSSRRPGTRIFRNTQTFALR